MSSSRISYLVSTAMLFIAVAVSRHCYGQTVMSSAPSQAPPAEKPIKHLSVNSDIGSIIESKGGLDVLKRDLPGITSQRMFLYLWNVPLSMLKRGLPPFISGVPGFTDEKAAEINKDLANIETPANNGGRVPGDPDFHPQILQLSNLPHGTGPVQTLFNGKDLSGWDTWLAGQENLIKTSPEQPARVTAIGLNLDPTNVFTVVKNVDGASAIRVSGEIWGSLMPKGDFKNYHLHVQYKWGTHRYPIDNPRPRNNGVLYHSYGEYGAVLNAWMNSVELEMVPGMLAGANPAGFDVNFKTTIGTDTNPHTATKRRFMLGGREIHIGDRGFEYIQANVDAERPIGEWNTIDVYVFEDRAIQVLNGTPVIGIYDITYEPKEGQAEAPLTHGRIQLQSEGAETFFRDVTLQPIEHLPVIVDRSTK